MLINYALLRIEKLKAQAAEAATAQQAENDRATARQRQQAMRAAMALCQAWGDSPQAIEQMRQDVQDTPAQLLPDLLQALSKAHHPTHPQEPKP